MSNGSKPDYIVKCRQAPDAYGNQSKYFHTIGAAWNAKKNDSGVIVVRLSLVPTSWDGNFILSPPQSAEDQASSEQ